MCKGDKRWTNRVSCRNLFRELKILTDKSLYIFEIICFMKKNKIYTTQYSDVHDYNTIHKQNLYIQFCNTECSKGGVINVGTKIFNGLPIELKNEMNLNVFKGKLKGYLLCNVFFILYNNFLISSDMDCGLIDSPVLFLTFFVLCFWISSIVSKCWLNVINLSLC
jgi:hypothetical protein